MGAFVAPGEDRPVELSIVIISYNSKAVTLEAIESLLAHPPPVSFEVIVLDNRSPDGSAEAIAAAFPQIETIANPENVGFARGNNIAAERARGRRILLLNPDTVTLAHSHDALWAFAEREPQRGIWGGRTLFADMSLNPSSCWRRITLWSVLCSALGLTHLFPKSRLFASEAYGDWKRDTEADVDIVTGCFLLIDTALWRRLGGFDPAFFMYAEEADLCLRAKSLGANPGITPDAEIVHLGGVSEATAVDKLVRTQRGRITLMRKHWRQPKLALGLMLMVLWSGLRLVGSRVASGRRDAPGTSRAKWGEVWTRRREWLAGYDAPAGSAR
jgi:GT2 family glycosyltransferase